MPIVPTPIPRLGVLQTIQPNQLPLLIQLVRHHHDLLIPRQMKVINGVLVQHTKMPAKLNVLLRCECLLVAKDEDLYVGGWVGGSCTLPKTCGTFPREARG